MYACVVIDNFLYTYPIQKKSQKADEYIRMIKDQLPIAVEQCIEAAGSEYEPATQRMLLRVSQWFGGFFFFFFFLNFIPCSWLYQVDQNITQDFRDILVPVSMLSGHLSSFKSNRSEQNLDFYTCTTRTIPATHLGNQQSCMQKISVMQYTCEA